MKKINPLNQHNKTSGNVSAVTVACSWRWAKLQLVLLAAGLGLMPTAIAAPNTFTPTGNLNAFRSGHHTATLLQNGKVLVTAGDLTTNGGLQNNTAELFDPATGKWTYTGSLSARAAHTATLLPNGKVLVAGGYLADFFGGPPTFLATAQIYDPASGTWSATGNMLAPRSTHTATLLPNGKVLIAGGITTNLTYLAAAELYDPATGTWSATGNLGGVRSQHTATLLPDGKVLVAGGRASSSVYLATAELYNPANGMWSPTGSLSGTRTAHTASLLPNGMVLVAGGSNGGYLATAQLYNPASGTWSNTGSMSAVRGFHTATVLPSGRVLVAGGSDGLDLATAQIYEPTNGTWSATGSMTNKRWGHTATVLPSGSILMAGGNGTDSSTAELFDPADSTTIATGSLSSAGARVFHTATLLPNGSVFVYGGTNGNSGSGVAGRWETYNADTGVWSSPPAGTQGTPRSAHTATLLPNGEVLLAGGNSTGGATASTDLYNGSLRPSGSFAFGAPRAGHTATLLADGAHVLVAAGYGGAAGNEYLLTAQIYDIATESWSLTGNLTVERLSHTASLLPNGKVLVTGGNRTNLTTGYLASAELYDPATGSWSATGSMSVARANHSATLLPNGKVLVAGGFNYTNGNPTFLATAELYDPAAGTWTPTGSMSSSVLGHRATLLPTGKVVLLGGANDQGLVGGAPLYDPATGLWSSSPGVGGVVRQYHTTTLLQNGKILIAAGQRPGTPEVYQRTAHLYDPGLGFVRPDWQPQIIGWNWPLWSGQRLSLFGSRFQGVAQASGGNTQDSSTSYPLVQLRSLDSGQTRWLPLDPAAVWSDTSFTSGPVTGFPFGPALVTIFTNGIPSDARFLTVGSLSIVSRKLHNGVPYDIPLSVNGPAGIECRSGGATNAYQIVFQFGVPVTFTTVQVGYYGTAEFDGYPVTSPDGKEVAVNLKNVSNAQTLTVTLFGVNDGTFASDIPVQVGVLVGDTTADRFVNSADISQTKSKSGQAVDSSNFRQDVTIDGFLNSADISLVKSKSGTALP